MQFNLGSKYVVSSEQTSKDQAVVLVLSLISKAKKQDVFQMFLLL